MSARLYLYAGIAVVALLAFAGTYIKGRSDGAENERQTQQAAIAKTTEQARAQEAADRAERDAREASYLRRIRELENTDARPVLAQPVRLCQPASDRSARAPDAAPSTDAAGSAGQPDVSAGVDLGPALRDYGRLCESLRIQLDELQRWVMATGPES